MCGGHNNTAKKTRNSIVIYSFVLICMSQNRKQAHWTHTHTPFTAHSSASKQNRTMKCYMYSNEGKVKSNIQRQQSNKGYTQRCHHIWWHGVWYCKVLYCHSRQIKYYQKLHLIIHYYNSVFYCKLSIDFTRVFYIASCLPIPSRNIKWIISTHRVSSMNEQGKKIYTLGFSILSILRKTK